MRNHQTLYVIAVTMLILAASSSTVLAQAKTLGVGEVKVLPAVEEAAKAKRLSLGRVTQSMDSRLIAAFNETRKFKVLARSDLDAIMKEQKLQQSGLVNEETMVQAFKLAGADIVLVVTVDDFQDFVEKATFEGMGESATKRVIRLGAVAKLYHTEDGSIFETADFQLSNKDISRNRSYSTTDGDLSDSLLTEMSSTMADRIAQRVVDVVYPARIIGLTDKTVTISRGDDSNIAEGQIWDVFALGEEMVDPDTGESYGAEEIHVGKVRVTRVLPKFSQAEIIEDFGIAKLQVLRPAEAE